MTTTVEEEKSHNLSEDYYIIQPTPHFHFLPKTVKQLILHCWETNSELIVRNKENKESFILSNVEIPLTNISKICKLNWETNPISLTE